MGKYRQYLLSLLLCLVFVSPVRAFSILAHEAIIDAGWQGHIKPLLLKKYPLSTENDLQVAQSYAYGGSLVADMGYIPGGSPYFTNLLHYVRSGDMVMTLLNEAHNLNEYAFAIGALSHYVADKYGHALATNPSVAILYPKLKKKFGDVVTYDNDHSSHSCMEFAYDVIQTVKGNYASTAYHNFIGFNIATPVLSRAFQKVYGQQLEDVFPKFDSAINTFRWGVRSLFPELARTAWRSDEEGIRQSRENITRETFCYQMPRKAFDNKYGREYTHIGIGAKSLAMFIEAMPKIGPFKKLQFRYPGVKCEELYLKSMDSILINYAALMQKAGDNNLKLQNINFDTGNRSAFKEYALADKSYSEWLERLKKANQDLPDDAIRSNIMAFYKNTGNKRGTNPNLIALVKQ